MGIAILGRLEVEESADRLGPRDRVVLSALTLSPGEVVSADRLADALWREELPPATWAKVVQGCIMRLRKVLGSQVIETSPHGYRLALPSDDIDVRRFERLVGRGRELLALGEPERAQYVLGEAMSLWRGPAYPDLDGWDAGRLECERLGELRREAEELRLEADLGAGLAREVIPQAQALVTKAPLRERRWILLALAQYRAGRQSEALESLRKARRLVTRELGLDPGAEILDLEAAILRQDPTLLSKDALPEPSQVCPYRGLVAFDVADDEAFFGREADIGQCLRRLTEQGILVVVGPSGSGKSSLVRAGVAASLSREGRHVVVIAPGTHPLDALTAVSSTGRRPVLVVDQFEEAVTLCRDAAERAEFFQRLVAHTTAAPLIIALRSDHVSDVTSDPAFARMVERGLYLLADMDGDDLRACIEGPARQAGLLLEPGLVDLLLREVEGEPGALPLLSHALRETWARREGRTLTVAGYATTGGIRGAVARTAEDLYARNQPAQQDLLRDLLLRLVVPSPAGVLVHTRIPRRLVASDAEHEQVIEELVAARLVTSTDGVLVLAHEAVARAWPRLQQWLEDDTEGQRILRHLSSAADTWDSMGRPDSELYRGSRLARALEWRDQTRSTPSPVELAFLDASSALANAELEAARDRAAREARARRRTRRLAVGMAVALVLTLVAAATATYFQRSASERADEASAAGLEADANRVPALSRSVGSLDLSLLLAARAARMANTDATQDALMATLVRHRRATQVVQLGGQADDVELAADGRLVFVSRHTGILTWDVGVTRDPKPVNDWDKPLDIAASQSGDAVALWGWQDGRPAVGVFGPDGTERLRLAGFRRIGGLPSNLGFRPDGGRLLLSLAIWPAEDAPWHSTIREVDVGTGETVRTFPSGLVSRGPQEDVTGTIADDGSSAVSWTIAQRPQARRVDLESGSSVRIRVVRRPAATAGFVPLATGVAQRWSDGAVTLYDRSGRPTQVLDVHQDQVNDVAVSPDRTWAVSVDEAGAVIVWTIDPGTGTWTQGESLVGHSGAVNGVAIGSSGNELITVSRDGTAITWDMSPQAGLGSAVTGLRDRWISNTPQTVLPGRLVVAPTRPAPPAGLQTLDDSRDRSVFATFLDPRNGRVVADVRVADRTDGIFGSSAAVSPDGAAVAVTHGYGATVLDTRTYEVIARIKAPLLNGSREFIACSAWTPDGVSLLLCAGGDTFNPLDGNLLVVDTATWDTAKERIPIGGGAQTISLSPDRRLLAVAMAPENANDPPPAEVRLFDAETLELVRVLTIGPGEEPFDVAFSPDGSMLATGGLQGRIAVFDVATGRLLHSPDKVHNSLLTQSEWLPDGRTVVTTGMDGTISLYDVQRGLLRVTMPASADSGRGYTFLLSVSDTEVVAAVGGRSGRAYELDPQLWLDHACNVAGRDLTKDEWASYLEERPYEPTCTGLS